MKPSHRALLDALKGRGRATVPELADDLGLNIETIREHLRSLADRALVRRDGTIRRGPGRPEVAYVLTPEAEALFPRREGELLNALGAYLVRSGRTALLRDFYAEHLRGPREDALARVKGLEGRARLDEVVRIFDEMGYMPRIEEGDAGPRLRLCHCPVRDLVAASRVPCAMEEQLLEELLGGKAAREQYIPSGDSACTYHVPVALERGRRTAARK